MKEKLNNFFLIYIMVCAEAITIGKLLPSRFLGQAITGQFYSQIFFVQVRACEPCQKFVGK
jgi:hypothetical protein